MFRFDCTTLRFACVVLIALRAFCLSEAVRRIIFIQHNSIPADDRRPEPPTRKSRHHRIINTSKTVPKIYKTDYQLVTNNPTSISRQIFGHQCIKNGQSDVTNR
jgi:hypothetical protein